MRFSSADFDGQRVTFWVFEHRIVFSSAGVWWITGRFGSPQSWFTSQRSVVVNLLMSVFVSQRRVLLLPRDHVPCSLVCEWKWEKNEKWPKCILLLAECSFAVEIIKSSIAREYQAYFAAECFDGLRAALKVIDHWGTLYNISYCQWIREQEGNNKSTIRRKNNVRWSTMISLSLDMKVDGERRFLVGSLVLRWTVNVNHTW